MSSFVFQKVDIDEMIQNLVQIYEEGYDFVDIKIEFSEEGEQIELSVVTNDEYLASDMPDTTEDFEDLT